LRWRIGVLKPLDERGALGGLHAMHSFLQALHATLVGLPLTEVVAEVSAVMQDFGASKLNHRSQP
jgi:hypothetical protein